MQIVMLALPKTSLLPILDRGCLERVGQARPLMENEIIAGQQSATPGLPNDPRPPEQVRSSSRRQFSKKQLALAFAIAAIADAIGIFTAPLPPIVWLVDFVTAVLLFVVLGWHRLLLPGLVMEAIPGVGILPLWLIVVGTITVLGTARPKLK